MLHGRVLGVVLETEFEHLYEGQPLFSDIEPFLRTAGFRLCELYNPQHFNTDVFPEELQGRGFLVVAESLFLKSVNDGTQLGTRIGLDLGRSIQLLKLAAISVAFDQLDYALVLCSKAERESGTSIRALAEATGVKYLHMLTELNEAAAEIQKIKGQIRREAVNVPFVEQNVGLAGKLVRFSTLTRWLVPHLFGHVLYTLFRIRLHFADPPIPRILERYGMKQVAAKRRLGNGKYWRLQQLYVQMWNELFK